MPASGEVGVLGFARDSETRGVGRVPGRASRELRRCGGAADLGTLSISQARRPALGAGELPVAAYEAAGTEPDRACGIIGRAAEVVYREPRALENRSGARGALGPNDEYEADPHVEGAVHLLVRDAAQSLDERKDRRRLGPAFDVEPHGTGRAHEIEQAIAGEVRERAHRHTRLQDGKHR